MSPVERLQAAIDKLEKLKADSTPGDWDILDGGDRFVAWHGAADAGFDYVLSEPVEFEREADAELIVTLHRTIDAQLEILRDEYEMCSVPFAGMYKVVNELPLALADAIINQGDADAPA